MVQVLPSVPGFGEQLGQTLAGALGNVGQGLLQRGTNKQDQSILSQFASSPNLSPIQQIQMFGGLSPGMQQSLSPLFSHFMQTTGEGQKESAKQQKELTDTNNILNDLESKKEYVGSQFGLKTFGGPLRRKTIQARKSIDSEAIALEGYLRQQNTKGALSANVFNELLKRIPNSEMSEREYQGSIDGIRDTLKAHGLKLPGKQETSKKTESAQTGKSLNDFKDVTPGRRVKGPDGKIHEKTQTGWKVVK